jgi:hypothetical protein
MIGSKELGLDPRRHQLIPARLVRALGQGVGPQPHLLTPAEAHAAGEAMFEHWETMLRRDAPIRVPLLREDAGWAELSRVAWNAVWAMRQAEVEGGNAGGENHRP